MNDTRIDVDIAGEGVSASGGCADDTGDDDEIDDFVTTGILLSAGNLISGSLPGLTITTSSPWYRVTTTPTRWQRVRWWLNGARQGVLHLVYRGIKRLGYDDEWE